MGIIHSNITAASFVISSTGDTVKLSGFLLAVYNDNDTLSTGNFNLTLLSGQTWFIYAN